MSTKTAPNSAPPAQPGGRGSGLLANPAAGWLSGDNDSGIDAAAAGISARDGDDDRRRRRGDRGGDRGAERGEARDRRDVGDGEDRPRNRRGQFTRADEADDAGDEFDDGGDTDELNADGEGDLDDQDELEADSDGEDEGDEEADADADEDGEDERFVVKVDGQEMEVGLTDLIKSYQTQKTVTKRFNELAEQRKAVESEQKQAQTERQAYTTLLGKVVEFIEAQAPSDDDIMAAMGRDPVEGFRLNTVRAAILKEATQFKDAYDQMTQSSRETAQARLKAEQEAAIKKLPELIPEWKADATRWAREASAVGHYLVQSGGFTSEELPLITDPRAMVIARKAWLYDRLMASKKDKLKPKSKPQRVLRSGAKTNTTVRQARRAEQIRERARASGDVRDVAALIRETESF